MRNGYDIKNSIAIGKQSKSDGEFFERMIDETCEKYRAAGIANIEKTPEPMKIIKGIGSGKFLAHFTKQAQPDYKGTLKGGRSVVFEAKMTCDTKILQSRVTDWQLANLLEHYELGAETFVLVYFMIYNRCYKIPIKIWADMKNVFGKKYVSFAELERFSVPTSGMQIDFLRGDNG